MNPILRGRLHIQVPEMISIQKDKNPLWLTLQKDDIIIESERLILAADGSIIEAQAKLPYVFTGMSTYIVPSTRFPKPISL